MFGEAVQPAAAPGVLIVIECFLHDGAVAQGAAGIGHEQGWMNALRSAESSAGPARAGGIVEGEVRVVQRRRNKMVFSTAEIFPKSFQCGAGEAFGMEREKTITDFEAMFERG